MIIGNYINITGTCIGGTTLNNNLVLFVKDSKLSLNKDFIYLLYDLSTTG